MPVRIGKGRGGGLRPAVQITELSSFLQYGASCLAPDMQGHVLRVFVFERMAVHAGLWDQRVFIQGFGAERGQLPLVNANPAVYFIAGGNMAVHQSVVNGMGVHID